MNETTRKRDEEFGIYLYVLELQNERYYVGITNNPEKRFSTHRNGKSLSFVKDNLPIINIKSTLLETRDRKLAHKLEMEKTIELIQKYGIRKVYGGSFLSNLDQRLARFKSYFETLSDDYYKNLEEHGNFIEIDEKCQKGIEKVLDIINNTYERYVVEYRTEIICRPI